MKAARLHQYGTPLQIEDVPVPEVKGNEVLVKVAAAYVCTSDIEVISGKLSNLTLPRTLGHNAAGYVEEMGPDVSDLKKGEAVAVFGGWGCGQCRLCRSGEEQLCALRTWMGFGMDGGYAEYLFVPAQRHIVKLSRMSPAEAVTFTDAALTPYRAVKKVLPHLYPGGFSVVIGIGNLGGFAVQILRAISPGSKIIAVDIRDDRLQLASKLGADYVVDARRDAVGEIKQITSRKGAQAILDIVGSDATLKLAASSITRKGIIVLVGLAGGTLPYSFMGMPSEAMITSSSWGSYTELVEVMTLGEEGRVKPSIERFSLEEINNVLHLLEKEQIRGQAVITF